MSETTASGRPLTPVRIALLVLLPFALGYFLSYLFRSVNAVVAPNLVADIGLTASALGLLTAAYLIAFAAFQLPLGLLLDRFGPRRTQAGVLCCAALGSLLFAFGRDALSLTLARGLIGLGFAGGLMSGFKAVVLWVPEPRRALANAAVMSFGALGIVVATLPTELAVQAVGWRAVFMGLAVVTLAIASLIFLAVPERPSAAKPEALGAQLAGLARVYRDAAFWRLAPVLMASAGTHIGIQTLWAGPWFRDMAGLDRTGVASHLLYLALAFGVGTLANGAVADWFVRRGVGLLTVMLGFLLASYAAQTAIIVHWQPAAFPGFTTLAWMVFVMTGQSPILAFPWLSSYFGAALSGRANTAVNLLIFGAAFGVQYAIGGIIDIFPATAEGGYDPRGYRLGFGVFLAAQVLALAWLLLGWRRLKP